MLSFIGTLWPGTSALVGRILDVVRGGSVTLFIEVWRVDESWGCATDNEKKKQLVDRLSFSNAKNRPESTIKFYFWKYTDCAAILFSKCVNSAKKSTTVLIDTRSAQ